MKKKNNEARKDGNLSGSLAHILIAGLVILAVLFLLNQKPWANYVIPQYTGVHGHTEDSWCLKKEGTVLDPQVELPAFMPLDTGAVYTISSRLTYDGSKDNVPFAFFYIHHMHCRAYLDGELLFSYMPEDIQKIDRAKSPGNVYVSFPMPEDCLGKEFTIEFVPPLSIDMEYELPFPVFGDYPSEAHHTFAADLLHNIFAMMACFLGIGAIAFATMALSGSEYREALYIGIFAVLFSIYNITECNFNFYVISNPYYTYIINYITFSLIPIFLVAFLRERLDPSQRPVGTAMLIIGTVIFTAEMVLHFNGIMDMREFLPILHISYFAQLMIIFVLIITMKKNRWKKHLVIQMVPILMGMLLDAAIYYEHWKLSNSDAAFTTLGVIVFLIVELYHVWRYSIEIYTESTRSKDYHEMAYVDALTGIGNRRAFEAEKTRILSGETSFHSLSVASVDINNLKTTNDSLGHAAGDFLIRNAANLLSELAEKQGAAFRVGGDEFIVFLYDLQEEEYLQRIQILNEKVADINRNSEAKVSLAMGLETVKGKNLDAAISEADRKMYVRKAEMKQEEASCNSETNIE